MLYDSVFPRKTRAVWSATMISPKLTIFGVVIEVGRILAISAPSLLGLHERPPARGKSMGPVGDFPLPSWPFAASRLRWRTIKSRLAHRRRASLKLQYSPDNSRGVDWRFRPLKLTIFGGVVIEAARGISHVWPSALAPRRNADPLENQWRLSAGAFALSNWPFRLRY